MRPRIQRPGAAAARFPPPAQVPQERVQPRGHQRPGHQGSGLDADRPSLRQVLGRHLQCSAHAADHAAGVLQRTVVNGLAGAHGQPAGPLEAGLLGEAPADGERRLVVRGLGEAALADRHEALPPRRWGFQPVARHYLQRFNRQGGQTVHVEGEGEDDQVGRVHLGQQILPAMRSAQFCHQAHILHIRAALL